MKEFHQNGIHLYNCDCMPELLKTSDDAFDLLICDCPYGIGEDGSKNYTRGKLAVSKDYHPYSGNDAYPPPAGIF